MSIPLDQPSITAKSLRVAGIGGRLWPRHRRATRAPRPFPPRVEHMMVRAPERRFRRFAHSPTRSEKPCRPSDCAARRAKSSTRRSRREKTGRRASRREPSDRGCASYTRVRYARRPKTIYLCSRQGGPPMALALKSGWRKARGVVVSAPPSKVSLRDRWRVRGRHPLRILRRGRPRAPPYVCCAVDEESPLLSSHSGAARPCWVAAQSA